MARKKISEFRAKQLLSKELELSYEGISVDASRPFDNSKLRKDKTYVVKVDEGVKKRMKQGLVFLDQSSFEVASGLLKLSKKGYTNFIIEPFITHEKTTEKYLSLSLTREGVEVLYSNKGGIDVEDNQSAMQKLLITSANQLDIVAKELGVSLPILQTIYDIFHTYHFTFFEINPLIVLEDSVAFLDIAAEVDSSAEFFVNDMWKSSDFRQADLRKKLMEEEAIEDLAKKSQASFKLDVLNPDGSVFMLLSGGGASIVLADEVYNLGYGKEIANYGEYSGNPNTEEVYLYTKHLLQLLLKSKAKKKVLVIAGGVANFTDIRLTFAGIIKALDEEKNNLKKQNIQVFVRRGGPHQSEGLAQMQDFLQKENLYGNVSGPEMPLQEIVALALKTI